MWKLDSRKVGSVEKVEGKGCGCSGHDKKEGESTAAGGHETSAHGADRDQQGSRREHSGCCGGHKAHK